MRLEALTLEKYGAFSDRRLELGAPGLTIVYGPNEAGKSTSLTAVSDFLFGIPNNSPLGLFGNDAMRVGARLACADGRVLDLKRRKGRTRTLTDAAGAGVDDGVLAGLLGAVDRARFTSLFGLNHETLRQGGEQLLAADGEIGRLIVEAGGGLRTLVDRLKALDAEAERLFAPRRAGDRAFYQALDAFSAADSEAKAATLSRDQYEEVRRGRDAAAAAVADLRRQRQRLAAETSALERLARVAPLLPTLRALEQDLAGFADLPTLRPGFDTRWRDALARRDAATMAAAMARTEVDELRARLDAIEDDGDVLALAVEIEGLADSAVLVAQARRDRPNRDRELADGEAQLRALQDRLGLASPAELAERAPTPAQLQTVQRLAREGIERRPALAAAQDRLADAKDTFAALSARIDRAQAEGQGEVWGLPAQMFAALPSQFAALETRERQATAMAADVAAGCLTLGAEGPEALAALQAPDADTVNAEIVGQAELQARRQRQTEIRDEARRASAVAAEDITALRAGGDVATDEALAFARSARDQAWAVVRASALSGQPHADPAVRADQVDAVSTRLRAADDLADRRTGEAQRAAALGEAERRQAQTTRAADEAEAALVAIDDDLERRRIALAAAFPALGGLTAELAGLKAFVARRSDLLRRHDEQLAARREAERQRAELAPLLDLLAEAERRAGLAADGSLPIRVQRATAAVAAQDKANADLQRARDEIAAQGERVASFQRAVMTLQTDEAEWRTAWSSAAAAIGASADDPVEAVDDLAGQWASARGVLAGLDTTRRRLLRMDEDEAELRDRVAQASARLDLASSGDAVAAVSVLRERLQRAKETAARRGSLRPEFEALARRADAHAAAAGDAAQAVATLAAEAGLAPDAEAEASIVAERSARLATLTAEAQSLAAGIRLAGDGREVAALAAELGEADLDELRGRLAGAVNEAHDLDLRLEAAIRAEQEAGQKLGGFEQGNRVNAALAERESATARMHAALERYVELKLARDLVNAAIARVRSQRQDPLVRRAGDLFARTTEGRFTGIAADIDERGQPVVVGVRDGGAQVGVSGMSDGTRDQLFLAFRLASVENYCRLAEPLPFVADDILVHFDDRRSAATLNVLAEFAEVTQVLLFTHHQGVVSAAGPLIAAGRASVAELQG